MIRMASIAPIGDGIVLSVGERVRGRVDRAKNGLSEEDYSMRKMFIEYLRFNVIGAVNVLFFFALNYLLNWLDLSAFKSLTVWAPSWLIGAVEAHAAHRWITFRSNAAYKESLMWAFTVYGVTAILSTVSVFVLADLYGMDYWLAWAVNTMTFGFATFLGLRYLAFPPSRDANSDVDKFLDA